MTLSRTVRLALTALAMAVIMFGIAAIAGTHGSGETTPDPVGRGEIAPVSEVSDPGDLSASIAALQARLERVPGDSGSWAALAAAYIQQARVTGDPSTYAKAAGVLRKSLDVKPDGNYAALTGQATLAAAQHDFAKALRLAHASSRINPYSAPNLGVTVDALVELGRYDEAGRVVQRMVDLKPSVPSYTRVSYVFELQGDLRGATYAMRQALEIAYSADDQAFALFELGELAFNQGRVEQAGRLYQRGLDLGTSYVPLLYGKAKVEAAQGREAAAVRDYTDVVDRYPSATYLSEFVDYLDSLGRTAEADDQERLLLAQQRIFAAAGVNVDLELALYQTTHGDPAAALRHAREAFADRKSVFVEDAYAWALHANGRERAALAHARHAARLGTQSALLAFHRGVIEHANGLDDAATASLQRALDINPSFSPVFAPQARALLQRLGGAR